MQDAGSRDSGVILGESAELDRSWYRPVQLNEGSHDTAIALGGFLQESFHKLLTKQVIQSYLNPGGEGGWRTCLDWDILLHVTEGQLCLLSADIRSPRPLNKRR